MLKNFIIYLKLKFNLMSWIFFVESSNPHSQHIAVFLCFYPCVLLKDLQSLSEIFPPHEWTLRYHPCTHSFPCDHVHLTNPSILLGFCFLSPRLLVNLLMTELVHDCASVLHLYLHHCPMIYPNFTTPILNWGLRH